VADHRRETALVAGISREGVTIGRASRAVSITA